MCFSFDPGKHSLSRYDATCRICPATLHARAGLPEAMP
jgi:hypothetical protein